MRTSYLISVLIASLLIPKCAIAGEKEDKSLALIQKARALSDIEEQGSPPYQITGEVRFFGFAHGEVTGRYSMIWVSDKQFRSELSAPGFTYAFGRTEDKSWRFRASNPLPIRVLQFDRGNAPFRKLYENLRPSAKVRLGIHERRQAGRKVQCIDEEIESDMLRSSCIDPESGLAVSFADRLARYEFSDFQPWGGKQFPTTTRVFDQDHLVVESHFTIQAPTNVTAEAFQPLPGAEIKEAFSCKEKPQKQDQDGSRIKSVNPIYPLESKNRREEGTVAFHAIISEKGTVDWLQVIRSAGPRLDAAAMEAVRQWQYRPYEVCGHPVEVETEITVNFSLRVF